MHVRIIVAAALLVVGGCVPQICTPGRTEECPCPGGSPGAQACLADGRSFGQCECPAVGGGTATGGGLGGGLAAGGGTSGGGSSGGGSAGGGAVGGGATGGGSAGGLAVGPATITADRTRLEFGSEFGTGAFVGTALTETLQVRNRGAVPLDITQATVTGSSFRLTQSSWDGGVVAVTSRPAFFQVRFTPTDGGTATGELVILSNASNGPRLVIPLQGTGVTP